MSKPRKCQCGHTASDHCSQRVDSAMPCLKLYPTRVCPCRGYVRQRGSI